MARTLPSLGQIKTDLSCSASGQNLSGLRKKNRQNINPKKEV